VTVFSSPEQIAVEQVKIEEQQRVLGIIPNFYVVYDHDAAPLTTKLKFKLALRAETDPITFVGVAFVAGLDRREPLPTMVWVRPVTASVWALCTPTVSQIS